MVQFGLIWKAGPVFFVQPVANLIKQLTLVNYDSTVVVQAISLSVRLYSRNLRA